MKILLANYAHAVNKSPAKLVQQMLSQFCESDRRAIENPNGTGREGELLLHLQEAFRQGSDAAYRDMLLVSRPWRLDLSKLTVPVFMWHGEADTLVPIAPAKAFASLLGYWPSMPNMHIARPSWPPAFIQRAGSPRSHRYCLATL